MKIFEKSTPKFQIFLINVIRNKHSTDTAALCVSNYIILEELSKRNYVGAVLVDLKKAFDTVHLEILLKKLFCLGYRSALKYQLLLLADCTAEVVQLLTIFWSSTLETNFWWRNAYWNHSSTFLHPKHRLPKLKV